MLTTEEFTGERLAAERLNAAEDLRGALARRGVTRRQLVKFCSAMLATLALPEKYLAQTVSAVSKAKKPVLVWLQFQDCAGCSESMLRSSHPEIADIVLDLFSWEYHEVIMAGSGTHATAALDRVVKEEKGQYLSIFLRADLVATS